MFTVTLVSLVIASVVTADCVKTPSRAAPARVKNRLVPLYSKAPFCAVVRFVPDVSFSGATVAVPAAICTLASVANGPKPAPKYPRFETLIAVANVSVLQVAPPVEKSKNMPPSVPFERKIMFPDESSVHAPVFAPLFDFNCIDAVPPAAEFVAIIRF